MPETRPEGRLLVGVHEPVPAVRVVLGRPAVAAAQHGAEQELRDARPDRPSRSRSGSSGRSSRRASCWRGASRRARSGGTARIAPGIGGGRLDAAGVDGRATDDGGHGEPQAAAMRRARQTGRQPTERRRRRRAMAGRVGRSTESSTAGVSSGPDDPEPGGWPLADGVCTPLGGRRRSSQALPGQDDAGPRPALGPGWPGPPGMPGRPAGRLGPRSADADAGRGRRGPTTAWPVRPGWPLPMPWPGRRGPPGPLRARGRPVDRSGPRSRDAVRKLTAGSRRAVRMPTAGRAAGSTAPGLGDRPAARPADRRRSGARAGSRRTGRAPPGRDRARASAARSRRPDPRAARPRAAEPAAQDRLGADARIGLEALDDLARDRVAQDAARCRGAACSSSTQTSETASPSTPGAPGPADPVDVVLGDHRQLEVDDVRQRVDVEAAGGDLGRDQDREPAGLEVGQRADALRLALVAVDRGRPRCRRARAARRAGWRRAWSG